MKEGRIELSHRDQASQSSIVRTPLLRVTSLRARKVRKTRLRCTLVKPSESANSACFGARENLEAVHQSDRAQPEIQLAEQVRDAPERLTSAQAGDPFAVMGPVDQGIAPQGIREIRVPPEGPAQGVVRDEGDGAGRQGSQIVVHLMQVQALQVRHVARDIERQDLPAALRQSRIARDPALEHEAALARPVAEPGDIVAARQIPNRVGQIEDRGPIRIGQECDAVELARQHLQR